MDWLKNYYRKKLILSINSLRETDYFSSSEMGQLKRNAAFIPPTFLRFILLFLLLLCFSYTSHLASTLLHTKMSSLLGPLGLLMSIELTDWIWLKYYRSIQVAYKTLTLGFSVVCLVGTFFLIKNPTYLSALRNRFAEYKNTKNHDFQTSTINSLKFVTASSGEDWFVIVDNVAPKALLYNQAIAICEKKGSGWHLIRSSELTKLIEKLQLDKPTYVWVEDSMMAYNFDGKNTAKVMVSSKSTDLNVGICYAGK